MQLKLSKWFSRRTGQLRLDVWLRAKPEPKMALSDGSESVTEKVGPQSLRERRRRGWSRGTAERIELEYAAEYVRRMDLRAEADRWDGSIDNMEKALEDYVSEYGELF